MTLSIVMDTSAKTSRTNPERVDPVENSQITAGTMISPGPSCARHNNKMAAQSSGAPGIDAIRSPAPAMSYLNKGGNHYAHRHTPYCACRKQGSPIAIGTREAGGELSDSPRGRLTCRVKDRTHDYRHQELQNHCTGSTDLS